MKDNNKINLQKKTILNNIKKRNNSKKLILNNQQILIKSKKDNMNDKLNKGNIKSKQKYNIDLFLSVKEQFQTEKSSNNNKNNIYLNFYNKHTKNQLFQKENKISKKFLDNNKEYIKEKQEKYKIKKEKEEKMRKQREKEDTNEYRKLQMAKLYKMEDIYKKEIAKRKNKNSLIKKSEKIEIFAKQKNSITKNIHKKTKEEDKKIEIDRKIINIFDTNKNESGDKIIKITREEYDKKLDSFIKQTRIYINELEKLPIANKSKNIYERELQLNKYIDEIQEQIKKYQLYDGIEIVEE